MLVTGRWPDNRNLYHTAMKLVAVLRQHAREVRWLITEQEDKHYPDPGNMLIRVPDHYPKGSVAAKYAHVALHQLRVCREVVRRRGDYDTLFFAFSGDYYLLPMVTGRLLGKGVIIRTDARPSAALRLYGSGDNGLLIPLLDLTERITYALADRIVPEAGTMVGLYGLEAYRDKVTVGSLYVDADRFAPPAAGSLKRYDIGFVGRFSDEKGILQFMAALPGVLAASGDGVRVVVIGDGELKNAVETAAASIRPADRVECPGWVAPGDLPRHLQAIRMIVVPSVKEGLPNIVLESMASGCIVLATPVGGIPDLVRDGETGFLLDGNSPEAIENGIIRVLNHPDPEAIIGKARMLVEENYSYDAAVGRYREAFL